jgi:hypothetical protein
MSGTSTSPGSLTNLYSKGWTQDFSYAPTEYNLAYLKTYYDSIVAGSSATTSIADYNGVYYTMATGPVVGLYTDVLTYFNNANTDRSGINASLTAKTSFAALNQEPGFTRAAIIGKLSASGYTSVSIPKGNAISNAPDAAEQI